VDYLRSCYRTQIYSFDPVTGHNVPETITWQDVPPGATPLGVHHQYASLNWTKGIGYQEQVGEIPNQPRPWYNGAYLPGLAGTNH